MRQREIGWADLMRAANAGDAVAYERVLSEIAVALRPIVRGGLFRAGRSAADAEDVVQEVLLAIHLKRHTWDAGQPIGPWIRAIARHKLIDALRRRHGKGTDLPIEDFADSLAAEDSAPSLPARDIERQIVALPAGQRDVVRAVAVEGLPIAAVAQRLHISEGAVRVALHRGIRRIAKEFGQQD